MLTEHITHERQLGWKLLLPEEEIPPAFSIGLLQVKQETSGKYLDVVSSLFGCDFSCWEWSREGVGDDSGIGDFGCVRV